MNKFSKTDLLQILILTIFIDSCSYPEMVRNELVYENDFENLDLNSIDGGDIISFNNTNVIGDFNNDGFTLFLEDVGDHDYVFISFDLYIHGSWDGNFNGFSENDKPDKWVMEFKPDMQLYKDLVQITLPQLSLMPLLVKLLFTTIILKFTHLKIILKQDHLKQI